MNWLLGAAAVVLAGPWVLRKVAENPERLRKGADIIESGRSKAVEYGKRGVRSAQQAYEQRRASRQVGTFNGITR